MSIHNLGPYSNLPLAEIAEVKGFISREDKKFFKSLDPTVGSWNYLISTLFHSVIQECKANGITYYSPANALALRDIIRNRAAARLARPGLQQDGPNTITSLHTTHPGTSNLPPDLRKSPAEGVGRGGAGRTGKVRKGKEANEDRSGGS